MSTVVFIRSNPVNPDSRLEKEAKILVEEGYRVKILAWNRNLSEPKHEIKNGYAIHRVNLKSPSGMFVFLFWPIWWIHIILFLLHEKYDIIHAIDADSYLPSLFIAKIKGKKLIYDIFDFYPEVIKLPRSVHVLFKSIDLMLLNYANKVIIVDDCRYNQIGKSRSDKDVHVIYNSPPSSPILDFKNHHARDNKNTLNIFYGGGFSDERDNYSMINVAKQHPEINLLLAGFGPTKILENIRSLIKGCDNIKFIGKISYEDILAYTAESDLLFSFYDPTIPNNRLASPNKLFESMMFGIPLITNEGVSTAEKVREEKCGLVINYKDERALEEAVLYLRDNKQKRMDMGINGRNAYLKKYSYDKMRAELINLYSEVSELKS